MNIVTNDQLCTQQAKTERKGQSNLQISYIRERFYNYPHILSPFGHVSATWVRIDRNQNLSSTSNMKILLPRTIKEKINPEAGLKNLTLK